jgi:hypothetical protein
MLIVVTTVVGALSGCQNETTSNNSNAGDTGEVIIGLTDAPGDFTTYTVDVVSLTLTKANGAAVETVPVKTRVDFARYAEMTEFLSAATIPAGLYVKATMTLDYSNADIRVEGDNGESIPVSVVQDENGTVISELSLDVRLEGLRALLIAPGVPAHLTLDFDLNATNVVDLNNGSPIVTVNPELLAKVGAESSKVHRARGPLQLVNTADSSFRLVLQPFAHVISGGDERFGTLKVNVAGDTVFDINGHVCGGDAGLLELSGQTSLTAVVVTGDLKFNPLRFEAREVRAGSSVAGGTMDVVTGNVTRRAGDVLTVKGATLIRRDGSVIFNDDARVTVGDGTLVRRQFSLDALDQDAISVGQRVAIFGTLINDQSQSLSLDASFGYAHLLYSTLRARVVTTSPLAVDTQSIDGRRIAIFDFTGTGSVTDADPSHYEIDPGSIDLGTIDVGDVVKVRGFVKPFGKIQSADFTAQTIVNVSQVPGTLLVGWPLTSTTALNISNSADGVVLDLTGAGLFHHISRAGVAIDLTQQETDTTIEAKNATGVYLVLQDGVWQLHTSYANYLGDLQSRLDNGGAVRSVLATGPFDDSSGIMSVTAMVVHIL